MYGGQFLAQGLGAAHRTVERNRAVHSLHAYFPASRRCRPGARIHGAEGSRRAFVQLEVPRGMPGREGAVPHDGVLSRSGARPGLCRPRVAHRPTARRRGADLQRLQPGQRRGARLGRRGPADGHPVRQPADRACGRAGAGGPAHVDAHDRRPCRRIRRCTARVSPISRTARSSITWCCRTAAAGRTRACRVRAWDHAMWFHRPARADGWLLFDQSVEATGAARGFATGRLFDRAGRLVATCAQEGLIRWT